MARPSIRFLVPAIGLLALALASAAPASGKEGPDPRGLIGGVGLTHLTVYDQRPAPDGLMSGSPHVHALTDEGYYVVSGRGRVELHDVRDGFRTVGLETGGYIQFPPGTLHRLVSEDRLVLVVLMGNAGLAERGDARIYFGRAVDEDPAEFSRLVGLAKTKGLEGALERRDAAVRAYMGLLKLWERDRAAYFRELERFIEVHRRAAAAMREAFGEAVEAGSSAWAELFRGRLEALPSGRAEGPVLLHRPPESGAVLGMCGLLRPVDRLEPVKAQDIVSRSPARETSLHGFPPGGPPFQPRGSRDDIPRLVEEVVSRSPAREG